MPTIAFLSDYGLRDEFVGVCHGVIARLCPEARVIDVHHAIPRHDVGAGARVLARALPFLPPGVGLAVVDPEVGARRRAVALLCGQEERLLVGPDNGLLMLAAERFGGAVAAVEISESPWRLEPVSATFHGRDLFAPVAARLAGGAPLGDAGPPIDPADLVPAPVTRPERTPDGELIAHVTLVDSFGNVELDAAHADIGPAGIRIGRAVTIHTPAGEHQARVVRTFADGEAGELLLYEDAAGMLAIAVNTGDAVKLLDLRPGASVRIAPA